MKRTTIFLEEALLRRLQQAARKQGRSFAAVVREAMTNYLAGPPGAGRSPLPSVTGQFASGRSNTSKRVDQLLWKDPHR